MHKLVEIIVHIVAYFLLNLNVSLHGDFTFIISLTLFYNIYYYYDQDKIKLTLKGLNKR